LVQRNHALLARSGPNQKADQIVQRFGSQLTLFVRLSGLVRFNRIFGGHDNQR
jgi:hypothetical protein